MSAPVTTLASDMSCIDALRLFKARKIRRAPVMEGLQVAGIISERDLYRIVPGTPAQRNTSSGIAAMDMPVARIMSSPVLSVGPTDDLPHAAALMLEHRVGGVPVMEHDALVGMITESDIFRAFAAAFAPRKGARILFDTPRRLKIDEVIALVGQCAIRGCTPANLLQYNLGDRIGHWLQVSGGDVQGLATDLPTMGAYVKLVRR